LLASAALGGAPVLVEVPRLVHRNPKDPSLKLAPSVERRMLLITETNTSWQISSTSSTVKSGLS